VIASRGRLASSSARDQCRARHEDALENSYGCAHSDVRSSAIVGFADSPVQRNVRCGFAYLTRMCIGLRLCTEPYIVCLRHDLDVHAAGDTIRQPEAKRV
jgi:hypothetical protein